MNENKSPAPAGAMQEVSVELIHEGEFKKQVDAALHKALRELAAYEQETDDKTGTVEVVAKIKIRRMPDTESYFRIDTGISTKVPMPKRMSVAKEAGGRLLCQPIGSNEDPNQQTFFDSKGRPITPDGRPALIDQETPPAVAGTIGRAAVAGG